MAAETTRTLYRTDEVMAFLDEDGDADLGDCFFPGSDDELSFEDDVPEDERYTQKNNSSTSSSKVLLIPTFSASDGDGEDSHEVPDNSSEQSDDDTVPEHVRCVNEVCVCVCECMDFGQSQFSWW